MKKLVRSLAVLLAAALSLIPAASLFAAEEGEPLPAQAEQITVPAEPEILYPAEEAGSDVITVLPETEEPLPEDEEQEEEEKKEETEEDPSKEEKDLSDLNNLEPSVTLLAEASAARKGAGEEGGEGQQDGSGNERIDLSITNNTGMFNVVSAFLETKDGQTALVVALNGSGYKEMFKGTYEQAAANGANTANWIHSYLNAAGKLEFRIPVAAGETYIPVVAVSDSYYQKYLNNQNSIERAFYPRQMVLDTAAKTLVTGDYEFSQDLGIVNHVKMFKPESAYLHTLGGPNSNSYSSDLYLTMGSDSFDKVFVGGKDAAASAEKTIEISERVFRIPVRWLAAFGQPESMQTIIGTPVVFSFHSVKNDEWYERVATIDEAAGSLTFDEVSEETPVPDEDIPAPPSGGEDGGNTPQPEDSGYSDTVGGNTSAVDNSTGLADGVYKPDRFAFSGGSGRIIITCNQVEVVGGKAYANIVFQNIQSGTTEMNYVKASGGIFYCTQVGGSSVARIPVELNRNNQILALTTKMSAAHEIAYTIFVYIAGADAQKGSVLTANTELDKEAPVIAGLEFQSEETIEKAEFFKIFHYSDGIRLLEIDMRLRADDPNNKDAKEEEDKDASSEEEEENVIIDEETGEEVSVIASKAEAQAKIYKGNVVKYLLVPENVEIPAGLDKETIVIQLPLKSIYSGSDDIRKALEKLEISDLIKSQVKEDKDNKDIAAAGDYKDLDLKKLIRSKCDLVLLPEDSIKDKKAKKAFEELSEDLANLDIPVLVDRSEYEETDEAKTEWLKVYGILFGCEEAADAAIQAAKK